MEGFLIVAGFILWLLVAVGIGSAVVYGAGRAWLAWWDRQERLIRADERRTVGTELADAGWWFSEDKITMDLLFAASRDLARGIRPFSDINRVREQWRTERKVADYREGPTPRWLRT